LQGTHFEKFTVTFFMLTFAYVVADQSLQREINHFTLDLLQIIFQKG
jgi:hypothetical protein